MKAIMITVALTLALAMGIAIAEAGPWQWNGNNKNTYGWQLMTAEERSEHQAKLRGFTDFPSCKAYVDEHHTQMQERAKAKGITTPMIKRNPCEVMKAKGMFK